MTFSPLSVVGVGGVPELDELGDGGGDGEVAERQTAALAHQPVLTVEALEQRLADVRAARARLGERDRRHRLHVVVAV